MGPSPLGNASADSRILLAPYDLDDDGYLQEILTRKMTFTLLVIYSIIFTLGLVGNGLVIFILIFYMKKTANTIWFLNLTVANFIFSWSLPLRISHSALRLHWPFGKAMCKLSDSIAYLNLYASAYFLMAISIDCYVIVWGSARAQNLRRNWLACLVAAGIWILALLLTSPRIHFRSTIRSPIDEDVIICFLRYGRNLKQAKIIGHLILISQYLFAFLIPAAVTLTYHLITALGQRLVAQHTKFLKIIGTVSVIFHLCWLPHHVFSFFDTNYIKTSAILIIGIPLARTLAFATSCINPILYVVMGYDFKARPRPSILSAFENAFGEESSRKRPETPDKSTTVINSQDV